MVIYGYYTVLLGLDRGVVNDIFYPYLEIDWTDITSLVPSEKIKKVSHQFLVKTHKIQRNLRFR